VKTAAEALEAHGFSGEQLLKLSRKAADDALRRHGAHLDHDRFDELADYMLLVGVRYAARYEPGHGIAIQTFLYRRMRIRYTDWLRTTMGDSRWGHRSRRIPPGGRTWPLHEEEGGMWDAGFDEVDERLSAAAPAH
jgi:hypothetical protein